MSPGFAAFLGASRIGLAVSSYQSGKFYLLGQNVNGGLIVDERFFRKAMGICVADRDTILLATLLQIFRFRNVLDAGQQINNVFDACYVPREAFITGELDTHDVGLLAEGRIVFVNTLYNCLATPSERHSFTPLWKPPFISKIVKEDRCHLNGLAMANGVPRYVTAVSKSDTIDGWRDRRTDGGIVIDVATGKVILGAALPAPLWRQAVGVELRHRRARLGRDRRYRRRLEVPPSRLLPRLSARLGLPRAPCLRRGCRSRAISVSRDCPSTASSPRRIPSPGAGCRSSTSTAARSRIGSASTGRWRSSTTWV
jgi:hypothetical protein